jgi:hypothetical protein
MTLKKKEKEEGSEEEEEEEVSLTLLISSGTLVGKYSYDMINSIEFSRSMTALNVPAAKNNCWMSTFTLLTLAVDLADRDVGVDVGLIVVGGVGSVGASLTSAGIEDKVGNVVGSVEGIVGENVVDSSGGRTVSVGL